jgi:hypothetical protein
MSEPSTQKRSKEDKPAKKPRAKRKAKKDKQKGWRDVLVWIIPTAIGFILAVVGFIYSACWWLATIGITLAAIGLFGFFLFLAEWHVWTKTKTRKKARVGFGVLTCLIIAGGGIWTYRAWNEREKPLRGFLVPGTEEGPVNDCASNASSSAFLLYFGDSVAWTDEPFVTTLNVIKFAEENVLSLEKTSGGIVVNAIIRDSDGNEVATIKRNVFKARSGGDYEAISRDAHSLLVLDKKDRVVLYIRYLNPRAVKITGIFREPNRAPLIVDDNGIAQPNGTRLTRSCFRFAWSEGGIHVE